MRILFIILFSIFTTTVFADNLDMQLQNQIQQYLNQNKNAYHLSAIQLSVILPNEAKPRDYVVGTQRFEKSNLATKNMMMQWGSITKEYTSMLIFKLAQDGDFKVTENLGQILPKHFTKNAKNPWPQSWAKVTLIQLMNMTSGIPDYSFGKLKIINGVPVWSRNIKIYNPATQSSMENLIHIAIRRQNQSRCVQHLARGCFLPGTHWFYSNTNYIILGLIVEKYTGMSFKDAINQYIFTPFKEKEKNPLYIYYTTQNNNSDILKNMIHGYFNNSQLGFPFWQKKFIDITDFNTSWAQSAGSLLGNVNTLSRLTDAFYQNKLANPDFAPTSVPASDIESNAVQVVGSAKKVTNIKTQCVFNASYGGGSCYAMGLMVSYFPKQGGTIWMYGGGTLGYNSFYLWIPSENVIIAIANNSGDGDDAYYQMQLALKINNIIRQYLGLPASKIKSKPASEKISDLYLKFLK